MDTTNKQASATIDDSIPKEAPAIETPKFGSGRYSVLMAFCFNQSIKLIGMSPKAAERFALNVGTQVGRYMKDVKFDASVKIGKTSGKEGTLSVSEALKGIAKRQESTPELQLAHALQWWQDACKHGWSYGFSKLQLTDELRDAVAAIEIDSQ